MVFSNRVGINFVVAILFQLHHISFYRKGGRSYSIYVELMHCIPGALGIQYKNLSCLSLLMSIFYVKFYVFSVERNIQKKKQCSHVLLQRYSFIILIGY